MQLTYLPNLFREAFNEWNKSDASLLAAALAYYGFYLRLALLAILKIILNTLFGYWLLGDSSVSQLRILLADAWACWDMLNRAGGQSGHLLKVHFAEFSRSSFGAAGLFVQTKRVFKMSQESFEEPLVLGASGPISGPFRSSPCGYFCSSFPM